jgi:hypothetical protein
MANSPSREPLRMAMTLAPGFLASNKDFIGGEKMNCDRFSAGWEAISDSPSIERQAISREWNGDFLSGYRL